MNTKQTCGENMARLRRGGKRVVIVVQRGLLLVDGLLEVDLDQVECHLGDVELGRGVAPSSFLFVCKVLHVDLN